MKKKFYKVHDLAEEFSLHPCTVRKLEKAGVISAQRDRNNYRVFTGAERNKLYDYLFPKKGYLSDVASRD